MQNALQNAVDPLSTLRDIHSPDPVSFWPPAPGWWIVGALLLILVLWLIRWGYLRYKRQEFKREAYKILQQLQRSYQVHRDAAQLAAGLSVLLRRAALAAFPREQTAGLQGEAWLNFLDKTGETEAFSRGPGKLLLTLPYQRQAQAVDGDVLLSLTQRWLNHL